MLTSLFDYELPESSIARHPPAERDAGRLLVLGAGGVEHRCILDFPELVPEGALVVVNESRVRRSRLRGVRRGTGGQVELLLLRRVFGDSSGWGWTALGRSSKPLRPGSVVEVRDAAGLVVLAAEITARSHDGTLEIRLGISDLDDEEARIERVGHVPIPPYLGRDDEPEDVERYQTVYARQPGSAAAPTAGLHLSERVLARLSARGVAIEALSLHVGLGTFKPVTAEDLDAHPMHAEAIQVPAKLVDAIARARSRRAAVVAVGTTVVRALESAADERRPGHVRPCDGDTRLFIQPGHRFRVVDALLTNFHMPKSTLLALVAAFAGRERVLGAYAEAVERGYRFLSYGDAMWLPERLP